MADELSGTADTELFGDPGTDGDQGTATSGEPGTTGADSDGDTSLEKLIDPATLPEELKPHWARMTRAYNQRLEVLKTERTAAAQSLQYQEQIERFWRDPEFAKQVIAQRQASMAPGNKIESSSQDFQVPHAIDQAVKQALADQPDMAFLAPVIAKAAWAVARETVAPIQQERQQAQQEQLQRDYQQMESRLNEQAPGWEIHEEEMLDLWNFFTQAVTGGQRTHPKYGSMLEVLYKTVTGQGAAVAEAGRRLERAVTNRSSVGRSGRAVAPDVQEEIRDAKTMQEKVAAAVRAAVHEVRQHQG